MKILKSLLLAAAAVAALSTLALAEPPAKGSTTATQTTEAAKPACHLDPAAAKKDAGMDLAKGASGKAAAPMAGCCSMMK